MRRPSARGAPDGRGRGPARRRPLFLRGGVGMEGRGEAPGAAQGGAGVRVRQAHAEELQVMNLTLHVWRQKSPADAGRMQSYEVKGVNEHASFLEMLDVLNEQLAERGEEPIAFEHDCREGICGSCGFMINGEAHGPLPATTVCQLHMRHFKDGDVLYLEPWRAKAFPVIKDLVVDRSAFDRIIASGGYISASTGSSRDGNTILIPKKNADLAMDAAA